MVVLRSLKRLSLRTQLVASFVFVIIITISLLSAVNYYKWKTDFLRQDREEGIILTQTLAQGSIDPILRNDFSTLEEYVNTLVQKENIAYLVISDRHNNVLAQSTSAKDVPVEIIQKGLVNTDPSLVQTYRNKSLKIGVNDISVPVIIASKRWGTVRVGFSLQYLEKEIYRNIFLALATGAASIVVGILVALILMRLITKPMRAFIKSMKTISDGNLHQEISLDTSYEFRMMADSFNHMAKSLRESKEELKKTYEELSQKHKLAALGEFAARVAHEIKNPLGIIKGSAQIILDKDSSSEIKTEVWTYIIEEIDRLNRKVMNILDYARPRTMSLEPTDINDLIEKTLYFGETQHIKGEGVNIVKKFDNNLPVIKADPEMMRQALLNLLINSYQAVREKGEIIISTFIDQEGWLKISFRDTGEGIPEKDLDKIFDPFFTTKKEGTGLGLSIVRQIIDNHKGKIQIESKVGEGTEIAILLPVQ
jgi:signal transduction histidine kinase